MRDIILGHKAERDELLKAKYVQREGIHDARQNMKNNLIKVIIGPRRAGKSVFGIQILDGLDFCLRRSKPTTHSGACRPVIPE